MWFVPGIREFAETKVSAVWNSYVFSVGDLYIGYNLCYQEFVADNRFVVLGRLRRKDEYCCKR